MASGVEELLDMLFEMIELYTLVKNEKKRK